VATQARQVSSDSALLANAEGAIRDAEQRSVTADTILPHVIYKDVETAIA
jgi:hypothetical protein